MHSVKYLASRNIISENLGISVYADFYTLLTNVIRISKNKIFKDISREFIDTQECESDQCKV